MKRSFSWLPAEIVASELGPVLSHNLLHTLFPGRHDGQPHQHWPQAIFLTNVVWTWRRKKPTDISQHKPFTHCQTELSWWKSQISHLKYIYNVFEEKICREEIHWGLIFNLIFHFEVCIQPHLNIKIEMTSYKNRLCCIQKSKKPKPVFFRIRVNH